MLIIFNKLPINNLLVVLNRVELFLRILQLLMKRSHMVMHHVLHCFLDFFGVVHQRFLSALSENEGVPSSFGLDHLLFFLENLQIKLTNLTHGRYHRLVDWNPFRLPTPRFQYSISWLAGVSFKLVVFGIESGRIHEPTYVLRVIGMHFGGPARNISIQVIRILPITFLNASSK